MSQQSLYIRHAYPFHTLTAVDLHTQRQHRYCMLARKVLSAYRASKKRTMWQRTMDWMQGK